MATAAPALMHAADSYLAQAQAGPLQLERYKSAFIERAMRDVSSTLQDTSSATAMDPTNPLAVSLDVESQKEYFRQLKFQYLEQESKRHFLFLITDSEPNGPTQRDNDELEHINAEKKALLKQTKAEIEDMRRETVELAEKNARRNATITTQTAEIQAIQAEIRSLELELSRLHATHPPSERLTIAMAEQVLEKQTVELEDATEALGNVVADADTKREQVARTAKEVLSLAREREKEEARAQEVRDGREGGDTKVDDLCRWYTATLGMYKALLGIRNVHAQNENELHITYDVNDKDVTLVMGFDPRSKRLVDAMLSEKETDISEAINLAVTTNDVPGLIGDVLIRLRRGC